jgi:hypothetical protein
MTTSARALGVLSPLARDENLTRSRTALPADTLGTIHAEIIACMRDHLPDLGDEFWSRCETEIPAELRSIKP